MLHLKEVEEEGNTDLVSRRSRHSVQSTDLSCTMKRSVVEEVLLVVTVWPPPSAADNDVGEDDGAKAEADVEVVEPSSTMTEDGELQTPTLRVELAAVSELCRSNATMEERSRGRCFSRLICPKILGETGGD